MNLELTAAEQQLTLVVLENRLGELRQEIHHSTVSTYTDQLKESKGVLQGIIDKLKAAQPGGVS